MNKYINKLKESGDLRNKMTLRFDEEPGYYTMQTTMLTSLTDSDAEECDNVRVDVNHAELLWDGWDQDFKVVSVTWEKFIYHKRVKQQKLLALYNCDDGEYYVIPHNLAKKEKLEI
jgi:hypothetical protein